MQKLLIAIIFLLTSTFAFADEEPSFWSNVDKFLGKIADGVSKKDAITGLRTIERYNNQHNLIIPFLVSELILSLKRKISQNIISVSFTSTGRLRV